MSTNADRVDRTLDDIPMEVFIRYNSEMHDDIDLSSVDDNSFTEDSKIDIRSRFLDDFTVESTYKDLEDLVNVDQNLSQTSFEPKTKIEIADDKNEVRTKNHTENSITNPLIQSTTRSSGYIPQHQDNYDEKTITADDDFDEDLSYATPSNLRWLIHGGMSSTNTVTCCSMRRRKRKKQIAINLHTRREIIKHQAQKPFLMASKMIFKSAERLTDTCEPFGLFLACNPLVFRRGNKCLLSNIDDDTISLPNIMSLDSSDIGTNGGEIEGSSERYNQEDLRWLYARQLQPVALQFS